MSGGATIALRLPDDLRAQVEADGDEIESTLSIVNGESSGG